MTVTSRSESLVKRLERIRDGSRTVPGDKALVAAGVAIRALGIDPARAKAACREQDAVIARYVYAGVLYRFCRMSYLAVGRRLGCGKATAQARIASFERLRERDEIIERVKVALAKLP